MGRGSRPRCAQRWTSPPVPAAHPASPLPWTRVTVVSDAPAETCVNAERWAVHTPTATARFTLRDGVITLEDGT